MVPGGAGERGARVDPRADPGTAAASWGLQCENRTGDARLQAQMEAGLSPSWLKEEQRRAAARPGHLCAHLCAATWTPAGLAARDRAPGARRRPWGFQGEGPPGDPGDPEILKVYMTSVMSGMGLLSSPPQYDAPATQ